MIIALVETSAAQPVVHMYPSKCHSWMLLSKGIWLNLAASFWPKIEFQPLLWQRLPANFLPPIKLHLLSNLELFNNKPRDSDLLFSYASYYIDLSENTRTRFICGFSEFVDGLEFHPRYHWSEWHCWISPASRVLWFVPLNLLLLPRCFISLFYKTAIAVTVL